MMIMKIILKKFSFNKLLSNINFICLKLRINFIRNKIFNYGKFNFQDLNKFCSLKNHFSIRFFL